jgi:hypothetical protein
MHTYVHSPQLASRLLLLALEALLELTAVCHGTQDACPLGRMGVGVDSVDSVLLARLATPPVRIGNEEQLVLCEVLETREILVGLLVRATLPGLVGGRQSASIREVFTQCETAVDVERLVVWARHSEFRILVYEALGTFFERVDCGVRPPVCVVSVLVVVSASRIESVAELMTSNRPKRAVGHVRGNVDVEDGELHDAGRENNLITWWVVVGIDSGCLCKSANALLMRAWTFNIPSCPTGHGPQACPMLTIHRQLQIGVQKARSGERHRTTR